MKNLPSLLFACGLLLITGDLRTAAQSSVMRTTNTTSKETLTNATIIEMVQLGLSDTVILEKMRQSECNFETSLNGLRQLKTPGSVML